MSEVREIFKLAADSLKNRTLNELLESDAGYQRRLLEEKKACQSYEELELTVEQRHIINTLIARKDETKYDYQINNYLAGMLDAYTILKHFDLTKE